MLLLLLDEPTSALDSCTAKKIVEEGLKLLVTEGIVGCAVITGHQAPNFEDGAIDTVWEIGTR